MISNGPLQFCDDNKIPYLLFNIKIDKKSGNKKIDEIIYGWQKLEYDELMDKYNNDRLKNPSYYNAFSINLNKGNLVVVDLDNKDNYKEKLEKYGNEWITYSTRKKLPHIWFKKDKDDKNSNKINIEEGVDILYHFVFEFIDSKFFNNKDIEMQTFLDYPQIKLEKKINFKLKQKKTITKQDINIKKEEFYKIDISQENKEILDNIDIKYWDNYGSWLKLIWALYNTYNDIQLVDYYCKKSKKYEGIQDVKKYILNDTKKLFSFGTIAYYSKLSNTNEYNKIRQKYTQLDTTDFGISNLYLNIIGDNIIKHNKNLYIYHKPFWKLDKDKTIILKDMRNTLFDFYTNYLGNITNELKTTLLDDNNHRDNLMQKIKTLTNCINVISKTSNQKAILEQINITLENNDYKIDLNTPNYFCFKCGTIFDVIENKKVESTKYDYISQHTGYNYIRPEKKQIDLLNKIINDIMPNKEIKRTYLSVLKQTLLGKLNDKFILFNGEGCNGKGWTLELLKELLNLYMINANKDILISPIKTGANSELARFNMKRCIVFSEPEEGTRLNGSTIKALTGGGAIEARGLYQEAQDINILATQILECNERPGIKGRADNSLLRRIIDIYFEITLTNDEELLKQNPKKYIKKNEDYKSQEFLNIHKYALLHILLDVEDDDIYISEQVKNRSKDYLMGNDELLSWVKENYRITDCKNHITKLKDMYDLFKLSEFYKNLSTTEKRHEWNKSNFCEKLKSNICLSKYYKDRTSKFKNIFTNIIVKVYKEEFLD